MEVDQEMSSAPSTDQEPMADQAAGDEGPESGQQSAKENKEPGRKKDVSHKDTITLEILQVIKEAQGQHGLKHGDYQRYRQYCSRRLNRLRKSLNYVQASGGRFRSQFHKKPVTLGHINSYHAPVAEIRGGKIKQPVNTRFYEPARFLYIPLVEAERSWSYSMQLKQEANTEPRKRFHLIRRLSKAVKHADHLEELCMGSSKADARTKLESQAYAAYMNGLLNFEQEKWKDAAEFLKKSQAIYAKLRDAITDEELSSPYRHRVEELKPTLRYCAFNLGEKDIDIGSLMSEERIDDEILATKLDQLIDQAREKQAVTLSEVQWLRKTLTVKQEKVRTFLLDMQDLQGKPIDKINIAQLEKLVFESRDVLHLLKESSLEKTPLYLYLSYLRLDVNCRRNLQLITTLKNPPELVRPYEMLISTLTEMINLPLETQFTSCDAEIAEFRENKQAQITFYRAYRCYYIAKIDKNTWKESVALFHRAAEYAQEALQSKYLSDRKDELLKLKSDADAEKFALYANNLVRDDDEEAGTSAAGAQLKVELDTKGKPKRPPPLVDRLDVYHEDPSLDSLKNNVVQLPPEYRPISCKPLFFDLALNNIEFPSLEEEKTPRSQQGGVTGFVKGWLGWGKK